MPIPTLDWLPVSGPSSPIRTVVADVVVVTAAVVDVLDDWLLHPAATRSAATPNATTLRRPRVA